MNSVELTKQITQQVDLMGVTASGGRAFITVEHADPVMGTPALAFWGGATLVAAAYDLGRAYG